MKMLFKPMLLALLFLGCFGSLPFQTVSAQRDILSPTPTYDPLVEPPLPENPSEFELGQNLYWHWCMTCHGDHGQGLTDEFRGIWEPEHQNCWARGCHAGRPGDEGFPIPTVVPAVVNDSHLAQFTSAQGLTEYLQATHPPQSPGVLKTEEYHAIALYVFSMNARAPGDEPPPAAETAIPMPTSTMLAAPDTASGPFTISVGAVAAALAAGILLGLLRLRIRNSRTR